MPIIDTFSKRQSKKRGEMPEVYQHHTLSYQLRVQIIYILQDSLGGEDQLHRTNVFKTYEHISNLLCREYGVFRLPARYAESQNKLNDVFNFILQEQNIERVLDAIELLFQAIDRIARDFEYLGKFDAPEIADRSIEELNDRFREHGIGYKYENGKIIRVDSEFIHSEVVKPALKILSQEQYAGAQQEFLLAHEYYRVGKGKEALNECLKALESVIKSICDMREWNYDKRSSAKKLISICFENEIIPAFWQEQFEALQRLLESSVPPARNKLSAHGQGKVSPPVPTHLVGYVLHMTASAVVFLAEAEAHAAKNRSNVSSFKK